MRLANDRRTTRRRAAAVPTAALLAALLALAGCGGTRQKSTDTSTVVVALESAPIHLDPRVGTDQASSRVFEILLNGLVTKDAQGNLVPDLAESWDILDGGKLYRFHLRPGVVFHDGRPFTSADVVWTFATVLDGRVTTPKRGAFQQLAEVRAVDPSTVEFVMTEPFGAMLVNLTSYMGIVPDGTEPADFKSQPVGTGPFKLVERQPERLVFEAFAEHWAGRPALDRLVFREIPDSTVRALELRKGSVQLVVGDLSPDTVTRFREDEAFQVIEDPGAKYVYLGINFEDPLLARPEVRRAMALAIDRQSIVDAIYRGLGVVTETVLPPGHWARNEALEPVPYDPAAARALLDEAGLTDPDGDGPEARFSLTYKTSTDETALLQAQTIQAMMTAVGIDLEIRSYEFATFYDDIKKGNFQIFSLTRTGIVDPDIYSLILHSAGVPPAGANRGRYVNHEFDRLVEAGAALTLPEERRPFYVEVQEIFARDLPYISLFTKVNFAVMPVGLEGYRNYPSGEFYSLARMRWTDQPEDPS